MLEWTETINDEAAAGPKLEKISQMVRRGLSRGPVVVALRRPKRSRAQNKKMWAMLQDISQGVTWFGQRHSKEVWKEILSASYRGQRAVQGVDGLPVFVGYLTSEFDKHEMSEFIESIYAFGAEQNVRWSEDYRSHESTRSRGQSVV